MIKHSRGPGSLATHTDFDGNIATYSYLPAGDPHAGMLHQVTYAGAAGSGKATQTVTYTYDALGRPLTTTDASGTTIDHYDAEGDLIEADTPEGVIHYGYDLATGRHVETWTPSTDTAYGYDLQGRLTTVSVNELNGQTLASPLVTSYDYDAVGNKISETLPDGEITTYRYDDLNRLTSVLEQQGSTTLFSQQFILNDDGTRHSVHETQLQADGSTEMIDAAWGYDAENRLTSEVVTSSVAGQSYANTFAYDRSGNRMSKIHAGPGGGADETIIDSYNGNDELVTEVSSLSGETDFGYDANGSLTTSTNATSGQSSTYSYDSRNKMVGFASGGTTAGYVYDDGGNRVAETVNGVTKLYLTDANNPTGYAQPMEEKASATAAPSVTYLVGDRVLGQIGSGGTSSLRYLLTDGHGSTRELTDINGIVISTLNYDAFGGAIGFDLAMAGTPFLFGGDAVYDPASGLYLHGDGVRGRSGFRFIEMDGQGYGSNSDPISLHRYLYANACPTTYVDPSGHDGDVNSTLYSLKVLSENFVGYVARINRAVWGRGGKVLGWFLNAVGLIAQRFAQDTLNMLDRVRQAANYVLPNGRNVDWMLQKGRDLIVYLEAKYSLAEESNEAFQRMVGQLQGALSLRNGQVVLWSLKEPTAQATELLQSALGPALYDRIKLLHGVEQLYNYLSAFFN